MPDINEQAAVKVMGWHEVPGRAWLRADNSLAFHGQPKAFKPAQKIAQCFEFIVPAMAAKGYDFAMWINQDYVSVQFQARRSPGLTINDPTKAAECIVMAALEAVEGMEANNGR